MVAIKADDGKEVNLDALNNVVCPKCGKHIEWDYDAWESICEYPHIAINAYCCKKHYNLKISQVVMWTEDADDEECE